MIDNLQKLINNIFKKKNPYNEFIIVRTLEILKRNFDVNPTES